MKTLDPVRHCGPEAVAWLQDFLGPENERLANDCFAAIRSFRTHDHGTGRRLLSGVDQALEQRSDRITANHILRRWSYGAWAYDHYLLGNLEEAESLMIAAEREIAAAVMRRPFLMPLVDHCIDFRIQRARIARKRHEWKQVRAHVNVLRGIYFDEVPFVQLPDGQAIYLRDYRAYYQRLDLPDELRESAQAVLNPDYPHQREFDRLEEDIFALPDFVIPYT